MDPIFARPGSVNAFPDQAAFIAFLEHHGVKLTRWVHPDLALDELWNEILNRDTVYTVCEAHGRLWPVRFLLTVAARVKLERKLTGKRREWLVLTEFVREGGFFRARKYADTSLSEKMKLDPCGEPLETCAETLIRCLSEEVRLEVPLADIRKNIQLFPWSGTQSSEEPIKVEVGRYAEPHVHEKKDTQPGLIHWNQIARYVAQIPERHHFFGMRQDAATRYLTCWLSVHESIAQFDPIPAELVLVKG